MPPAKIALFNAKNISADFCTSLLFAVNLCTEATASSKVVGKPFSPFTSLLLAISAWSAEIFIFDITFSKLFKVSNLEIEPSIEFVIILVALSTAFTASPTPSI